MGARAQAAHSEGESEDDISPKNSKRVRFTAEASRGEMDATGVKADKEKRKIQKLIGKKRKERRARQKV